MSLITKHCLDHNANQQQDTHGQHHEDARLSWFDQARYGLFLHWGLYSILSDPDRNEWVLFGKNLDLEEYNLLARQFIAQRYDPKKWAKLARRAGMNYVVLTTRHHDGFCLFISVSRVSHFSNDTIQAGGNEYMSSVYVIFRDG